MTGKKLRGGGGQIKGKGVLVGSLRDRNSRIRSPFVQGRSSTFSQTKVSHRVVRKYLLKQKETPSYSVEVWSPLGVQ